MLNDKGRVANLESFETRKASNELKGGTVERRLRFSLAKVWTMVAGGGASVVYSDTVAVRSLAGVAVVF